MIVKMSLETKTFEDILQIPLTSTNNLIMNIDDFSVNLLNNYPDLRELLEAAKSKRVGVAKEFYLNAKAFLIRALETMKKKLPFEDDIINASELIYFRKFDLRLWQELGKNFSNIVNHDNYNDFMGELSRFKWQFEEAKIRYYSSNLNLIIIWRQYKKEYPTLFKIAMGLIVLPYSSSQCESLFCELKAIKTPYRNRLSLANLEASLMLRQHPIKDIVSHEQIRKRYKTMWRKSNQSNQDSQDQGNSNGDARKKKVVINSSNASNEAVTTLLPISSEILNNSTGMNINNQEIIPNLFSNCLTQLFSILQAKAVQEAIPNDQINRSTSATSTQNTMPNYIQKESDNKRVAEAPLDREEFENPNQSKFKKTPEEE